MFVWSNNFKIDRVNPLPVSLKKGEEEDTYHLVNPQYGPVVIGSDAGELVDLVELARGLKWEDENGKKIQESI